MHIHVCMHVYNVMKLVKMHRYVVYMYTVCVDLQKYLCVLVLFGTVNTVLHVFFL